MNSSIDRASSQPAATHIEVVFRADGTATPQYHPLPHIHEDAAPASPASTTAGSPSAQPLLSRFTPSHDSPSVSVTVQPEGIRSGDLQQQQSRMPRAYTMAPASQRDGAESSASTSSALSLPSGTAITPPPGARPQAEGGATTTIKAHYFTGSAAKRRSSAASIIRQQSPSASVIARDKSMFNPDLLPPVLVRESPGGPNNLDSSHGDTLGTGSEGRGEPEEKKAPSSVFDMLNHKDKSQAKWQSTLARVLDGVPYTLLSLVITFMVLYSDDFRIAVAPRSSDDGFRSFTIFCLTFFALEVILSSLSKPKYFLGFYFLIDCVATASLLFDIPEFMALLTGERTDASAESTLAQASNEGQSNLRAARIAQVIRVVRLIRIVKLYKIYAQNRRRLESSVQGHQDLLMQLDDKQQSRVGEKLTELTIRKVIIMVLALLFLLPIFEVGVGWYGSAPNLDDNGLQLLHGVYATEGNGTAFMSALDVYLDRTTWKLGTRFTSKLLKLGIHNITLFDTGELSRKRDAEVTSAKVETEACVAGPYDECFVSAVFFDTTWYNQVQALLNMGRTTFIISILVTAALLFMRDADRLVLRPLERMVKQVRDVSENPLARLTVREEDSVSGDRRKGGKKSGKQQLETKILENSITKICSLLSVGFGEAGAEVIADNIRSGGDLNPMIPGRKVTAIFGFCDIRQFTDTTEVLQEDIMEFVNSIAKIVHMEVALHGGAANKNIGDAFLLVWKLPEKLKRGSSASAKNGWGRNSITESQRSMMEAGAAEQHKNEMAVIADAALASFVIIQAAIKRSSKLQQYSSRPDLNARIPNFGIRMGFGLHVGWAIEGAIGSEFKIDASYLSPHVNMASRLEAATKQFGTTILLSEHFVRLLSPRVRSLVRQIDCVTVKGSKLPMGLYTYDASCEGLDVWTNLQSGSPASKSPKAMALLPRSPKVDATAHESYSLATYMDEFKEHPDIIMTRAVDPQFLELFDQGFQAYIAGDWQAARRVLEECLTLRRNRVGEMVVDGPTQTLLGFMESHGFEAPMDWRGFRELTEK